MTKLGSTNALSGYFWATILENYCHICNPHLLICLIAKLRGETKMLKSGIKNDLFEYF